MLFRATMLATTYTSFDHIRNKICFRLRLYLPRGVCVRGELRRPASETETDLVLLDLYLGFCSARVDLRLHWLLEMPSHFGCSRLQFQPTSYASAHRWAHRASRPPIGQQREHQRHLVLPHRVVRVLRRSRVLRRYQVQRRTCWSRMRRRTAADLRCYRGSRRRKLLLHSDRRPDQNHRSGRCLLRRCQRNRQL